MAVLEWATSSPPPFYSFALLPKIHDRDEHHYAKEHGLAYKEPERYSASTCRKTRGQV